MPAQGGTIRELVGSALQGRASSRVQLISPNDALREVAWGAAPVRDRDGRIIGAVLTEVLISQSVQFKAHTVREAYSAYEQLQRNRGVLRFNVLLILALATMLVVFAFSWFAMYLAKRITVPIQALAEGAAAVAAGDLDHRVETTGIDELGDLVRSFNQMTGELKENKARIEAVQASLRETNAELEDRRRYIETILQTIATGVVSLDAEYRVRTMNRAAAQMFEIQDPAPDMKLDSIVQGRAAITLRSLVNKSAILGPVVRTIELVLPERTLHLATTVTPFVDSAGERTGWVIAFDDVTELLRVEKMAAWQEVARRLAHEIKNPLTPIQLSAERIRLRYRNLMEASRSRVLPSRVPDSETAAFELVLEESVRTITEEATSLKSLVDEFSRFARMPEVRLEEADLHRVIENSLALYNGRIVGVEVVREFDPEVPQLRLDTEQLKRVFVNLIDNALEAMAENPRHRLLKIRTICLPALQLVRVEVSDTGRGFPKEYQDSLFLPYFSTRTGGTGLGLAIVRQIISDHKGYVRAEQNAPAGTRVVIDLPLVLP
jgi:two-component system, NtrC family, nitrogen regulation sensor histidine kinase NtrY